MHCHILPNVDDGAKSIEESFAMIDIAKKNNITDIILTPHYKVGRCGLNKDKLIEKVDEFSKLVMEKYKDINIYAGTELMYSEDAIELLEKDLIASLNESKNILVEFHPSHTKTYIKESLYKIICTGYTPVLAHIERYSDMIDSYDVIEDIIDMGVLIQINADSVTGRLGRHSKKFVKMLMKYDFVHFIGTDAHSSKGRTPVIEEAAKYIEKRFGSEYRDELLIKNPAKYFNIQTNNER